MEDIIPCPFTEEQEQRFDRHCERNTWPLLERFSIEDIRMEIE